MLFAAETPARARGVIEQTALTGRRQQLTPSSACTQKRAIIAISVTDALGSRGSGGSLNRRISRRHLATARMRSIRARGPESLDFTVRHRARDII